MQWLWCRVSGEVIANVLILARQKTIVAIVALGNINYQVPLFHKCLPGNCRLNGYFHYDLIKFQPTLHLPGISDFAEVADGLRALHSIVCGPLFVNFERPLI
jgi:hypothetical protein|tara:strand:- start:979 stop:1284 length:306 start_codon:yes stop_codon:yes gene_type:complete